MYPSKQGFFDNIYAPAITKIYAKIRLLVLCKESLVGFAEQVRCLDNAEQEALFVENTAQLNLRKTLAVLNQLENLKVAIQWSTSGFNIYCPAFIEGRSSFIFEHETSALGSNVLGVAFLSVWIGRCQEYLLHCSDVWTVYQLLLRMCDPAREDYSLLCNEILQCADAELRNQKPGVNIKKIIDILQKLVRFHVILEKSTSASDESRVAFVRYLVSGFIHLFFIESKVKSRHYLCLENLKKLATDEHINRYFQVESKNMQKNGAFIPYSEPRLELLESMVSLIADKSYRGRQISQARVTMYMSHVQEVFSMVRGLLKLIPKPCLADVADRSPFINFCASLVDRILDYNVANDFDIEKVKKSLQCAQNGLIQWECVINFSDVKYRFLKMRAHQKVVLRFKCREKTKIISLINSKDRVDFSFLMEFIQLYSVEKPAQSGLTF